ncbi:zinc knuckle CX2CX4HX4C containing protein [Tanacetum coccineum]
MEGYGSKMKEVGDRIPRMKGLGAENVDVPQRRMAFRVLGNPSLGSNSNISINDQAAAIKEIHDVETLFGVKFTSQSDIDVFYMSIKEGKYADILSTMSTADIDAVVNAIETIGNKFQDEVNKAAGTQLRSSPMMSNFSPLLINDIESGKHDGLLSGLTNADRMETLDALGSICNSIQANRNNTYVTPCKVLHADDSINLNVDESTIPSLEAVLEGGPWLIRKSPIILKKWPMDTRLIKEELTRISIWVKLHDVPIQVFEEDGISLIATFIGKPVMLDSYTSSMCNESCGKSSFARCLIEVVSPPIVTTSNVVTPTVEKTNDGFQTVGKKKKMKGKSKSTNGGQFTGPFVKHNVRYEPKVTTTSPKKGATYVGNTSQSSSMLKTTEDDEEDVENVHDESANLIHNTNSGGSSSFTAAAG